MSPRKTATKRTERAIPAVSKATPITAPAVESTGAQPSNGRSVLIVDDFPDNREMYADFLGFAGFTVFMAANGKEALDQAFANRPDIVLMDLSLPGMDGWEATRRLKADPRTRDIPVVALTGHALAGHSQGAKEAGCDGFIAKPCLPEDLLKQLNSLLDARDAKSERS
jgi:two-component system, cell cycle response regulator DivK